MTKRSILVSICLLLILMPLSSVQSAAPRQFSPVQKGYVGSAESVLPYAPNRILIKFTDSSYRTSKLNINLDRGATPIDEMTGLASVDAISRDLGVLKISRPYIEPKNRILSVQLGVDRWFRVDLPNGVDIEDVVARYAADPNIEYAKPDYRAFPAAVPGDPLYADHWGHNNTAQLPDLDWGGTYSHTLPNTVGTPGFDANAQGAWDGSQGFGSSSIIIAIIDSGVDIDHPDLNLVSGYDFGDNDSNPDDNSAAPGHGTCCAGVAASLANNGRGACGAAPGCRIMPVKVANSAGSMYFSSIENGLYWAADNGADVISISLGAPISSDPATDAAIAYAYNSGCVIVAATGNENDNAISYPAINAYVVGVGAASPCGDRKRSSSSSTECNPGVNTDPNGYTCDGERWWGSNYGTTVKDAAGAVDILGPTILPTTDIGGSGGYTSGDYDPFFNGTSCATPYVAGVAALVKSKNPAWTAAQIRDQICDTAIDIVNVESGSGWDRYSGYGMVDAEAAVGGGGPVAPVAEFYGTPTSGTEPLTVNFTDQSTGAPTSWAWSFGDGGTSTAQNPNHTYNNDGSYTVTLTVTNSVGSDAETKSGYITVSPCVAPVAAFTGSPTSGDAPLAVSFTDQSTGAASWSWTFGDGGTSTAQNPSHTYTSEGTYTVSLTVVNSCGSDGETKSGYITVTEAVGGWEVITYDDFEGGFGNYTSGGGDCSLYTSGTYAHQGSNAADIQDNSGVASSFYHTASYNVSGYTSLEVDFWFYAYSMDNTSEDFWVQYFDGSTWRTVATYARTTDFENGVFYHKVVQIPASTYNYPANAKLRFMCDASGNADDVFIDEVEFRGFGTGGGSVAPVAAFTGTPTTGDYPLEVTFTDQSENDPESWSWAFGDGGTSTAQNPTHTYTAAGTYTVTLTAANTAGSDDEVKTGYITVTEPSAGGWTTITYDDFEGGFGSYTDGGGDCSLYAYGTYAHQGSRAADIQDNSGTASSFYHTASYNVSGYSNLEVEFWFMAVSMDRSEDFWVQYFDGSAWRTVASYTSSTDYDNGIFYNKVVQIPAGTYNYPTNAKIRFMCDASNNTDDVYIDEIEFRGYSGGAMASGAIAQVETGSDIPEAFKVCQNYPNPFNPVTTIRFELPKEGYMRLDIFNVAGQRVANLVSRNMDAGVHEIPWNAAGQASGVYFYRIMYGDKRVTKKMILLR
ncbi:MAG: PKD domain-containing protein [Candidatus Krumholzibacteriota bacterium]|nr:PKD domain-containing protein [Candidatus Krumholzibacteriota bacterium]